MDRYRLALLCLFALALADFGPFELRIPQPRARTSEAAASEAISLAPANATFQRSAARRSARNVRRRRRKDRAGRMDALSRYGASGKGRAERRLPRPPRPGRYCRLLGL